MALARLALKNLHQRVFASSSSASLLGNGVNQSRAIAGVQKERWGKQRRRWPWRRNNDRDFAPALYEFFPSGLGNALMQATENINRLFEDMNLTPWSVSGRVKEKDDHYKLRYDMPGISKEDVKITVDDGVLTIKGEHKEEKEEGDDDEYWSSRSYGYYNTSLMLPEDAKADEIKAELKDGVLSITIPRAEKAKKDVKEVEIH
ncbi:putative Small heat-shock protein [Quillaja saponaria]|uniref:Small heat-shock protein n=1 Tax=Quillaja saponaria TaxID=32244 RepID=A0AAD7LR72_QUISA|nr:putative Small heat-shock protein [Quillaja saponaria]